MNDQTAQGHEKDTAAGGQVDPVVGRLGFKTKAQDNISFLHTLSAERCSRKGKGGHADQVRRRIRAIEQMEAFNERFSVY